MALFSVVPGRAPRGVVRLRGINLTRPHIDEATATDEVHVMIGDSEARVIAVTLGKGEGDTPAMIKAEVPLGLAFGVTQATVLSHIGIPTIRREHGKPAGDATTTDTCSQHTRAGRRGSHEQRRAHSPQCRRPT